MIVNKMIAVFFIVCCITVFFYNQTNAEGWGQCKGSHNGNLAPDANGLKNRYDTAGKAVAAAKRSENSLMENIKNNEKLFIETAQDIGLK